MSKYRSYDDAKKFMKKNKITSYTEFVKFRKGGKRPKNIPSNPQDYYKEEFISWGDFLGTGRTANQNRKFRSFEDAKKFVKKLGIVTQKEYKKFSMTKKKPFDIPADPQKSYKEFSNWGDFLGTGRTANQNRKFRSFEDAKKFVKKYKFGLREWQKFAASDKRPDYIPSLPMRTYKKEWKGWGDFFGTGSISGVEKSKNWLSWPQAKIEYRRLAKEYGLKNRTDWLIFEKKYRRLVEDLNLPSSPWSVYTKERVWRKMKND